MKLLLLSEGDLIKALARACGSQYGRKPLLQMSTIDTKPENGGDSGSRATGFTSQSSGTPMKPRHRRFLGLSTRQFSLSPPGL
jgi:hypothetical protein